MHRALQRQLKRALGVADDAAYAALVAAAGTAAARPGLPPDVAALLAGFGELMTRVSASYESNDRDIELRTRSLDISSEELNTANARLREELQARRQALASIRQTLAAVAGRAARAEAADGDDIAAASALLAELVREREKERHLLDSLKFALDEHAIVSMTDTAGTLLYANDRFCASSGYSRDELIGRNHRIVRSERHPPAFFDELWHTIAGGQVWHGEICNRARDGRHYWVAATIVPFLGADGRPYQYIGILTDISARKTAEDELILARDAAQAANRAKSEFLATMSHEFRTPMNGILGMTDLALDLAVDAEQREQLEVARGSAQSLLALLNDILEFSRIEAGQAVAGRQAFSPARLLADAVAVHRPRAGERGLDLDGCTAPSVPETVWGDAGHLRKILQHLLSNAVKFTERGGVTVGLEARPLGDGRLELRFDVRDTGIGIARERQRHIFEAFTQLDGSSTRRYGGTGLGLAISQRLAAAMGGRLWLESEEGAGSVFHLAVAVDGAPALPEVPTLGAFDYAAAVAAVDPDIVEVLVPVFLAHVDGELDGLRAALEAADGRRVECEARTVASSLAALNAEPARRLAARIEAAARDGDSASAAAAFAALQGEVTRFREVLAERA